MPTETHTPRIAVLIMAHTQPKLLDRLVSGLVTDFDVYLHLDRASGIDTSMFAWRDSVRIVPSRRTFWGSFQVTLAILDLLKAAHRVGYDRYVLISGQDTPIVSNATIRDFYSTNASVDFIMSIPLSSDEIDADIARLTRRYWHAPYRYSGLTARFYWAIEYALELGYRSVLQPKLLGGTFYWGETWFSLRHDTLSSIFDYLHTHPDFMKIFRGSRLAEESFIQTLVRRISPAPNLSESMNTYTDWVRGPTKPRVLDITDVDRIEASGKLFARKIASPSSDSLLKAIETRIGAPSVND